MINLIPKLKKHFSISRMNESLERIYSTNYSEVSDFKTDRTLNRKQFTTTNIKAKRTKSYISFTCPLCHVAYDTHNRRPLLFIQCKHSICESCIQLYSRTILECPHCFKKCDISNALPYNWTLLSLMDKTAEKENINPAFSKINSIIACEGCKEKATHICCKHGSILCAACGFKHITNCSVENIKELDEISNSAGKLSFQLEEIISRLSVRQNETGIEKAKLIKELDGKITGICQEIRKAKKCVLGYYKLEQFILKEDLTQMMALKMEAINANKLKDSVNVHNQLENIISSHSKEKPLPVISFNNKHVNQKIIASLWKNPTPKVKEVKINMYSD